MKLFEIEGDIFNSEIPGSFVQCISADFACGKGIAVQFNNKFNIKNFLQQYYINYVNVFHQKRIVCYSIYINHVYNLITKERYYETPTYISLQAALNKLKSLCIDYKETNLKMPRIGCGLDRLEWINVRQMIVDTFSDTDINVFVYYL